MSYYDYPPTSYRNYGRSDYSTTSRNYGRSYNPPSYRYYVRPDYSTTSRDYGRSYYSTDNRGYGRSDTLNRYVDGVYGSLRSNSYRPDRYEYTDYDTRDYYGRYGNRGSYSYRDDRSGSYGSPRYAWDRYTSDRYGSRSYGDNDPYRDDYNNSYRSNRHDRHDNRDRRRYEEEKDLKIKTIDLMVAENAFDHNTYKYDAVRSGRLVLRRGRPFQITLCFNREFNEKTDDLKFTFKTGAQPDKEKGTYAQCMLGSNYGSSRSGFKAEIHKLKQDQITVSVYVPSDSIVSSWKMTIETDAVSEDSITPVSVTQEVSFIILFNPWCPDDDVYFPDERYLEEYINNDSGVIFMGTAGEIGGKPWFFGQFENGIVEASIYAVQKAFHGEIDSKMSDPIQVSRAVSRIVNSQDDSGVLNGNWSGDYTGGVSPLKWSGSVAILSQYMETQRPVSFGQCFVFSGIVTTICRALGIPCRSITNFKSAHDTNGNITIDVYYDKETGTFIDRMNKDSIWNYHVWNDVWMTRKDLPSEYSGWQAIDATPQESSNGRMQCGPVSLKSVKDGLMEHKYDAPFVFAEVNGDRITWDMNTRRSIPPKVSNIESSVVGKKISTKVPDGRPTTSNLTDVERIRQDITDQYKYKDGSSKEREIVKFAAKKLGNDAYPETSRKEIEFEGFEGLDKIMIGSDFEISGSFRNNSHRAHKVAVKLMCESETYTGQRKLLIKEQVFRKTLSPNQATRVSLWISYHDYGDKIDEQAAMKCSLFLLVLDREEPQLFQEDFRFRRPDLSVDILERRCKVNKPTDCRLSFTNPLPVALRRCTITIEGSGIKESHRPFRLENVQPRKPWSIVFAFTPTKPGRRQFTVTFNSDEIEDISGVAEINVE